MKKVLAIFASPKLTVLLLALGMVLVFAGTLAQVDKGIWTVMGQYFRCFVALVDLPVFFPRTWPVPAIRIPFPGGFLLGMLLVANLLAVQAASFRVQARGARRAAGFALLLLGALVTAGVMLGWGAAPVAATESDAFWRVLLRLGRGGLAAAVLFAACLLLYRRRAGLVLLHGGILFLLVGEFATALHAVEATMTVKQGETVGFIDHSRQFELSFTDRSHPEHETVTVIPQRLLKDGARISPEGLPFDIAVHRYMANSSRPQPLQGVPETARRGYPPYDGLGSRLHVAEVPEASGVAGTRNAPAIDIELFDRASGAALGRHLLSSWFYPNFVNRAWNLPERIAAGGKEYEAYLRFRREYLRSESGSPYSVELLEFVHERYEGTQMPKHFASHIRLVNEGDGVDRELRIWMNNPLRYARRTFYQSGYLPGDGGTILQVVRNETWMVPYLACMIVFAGMAAHFGQSLARYLRRNA